MHERVHAWWCIEDMLFLKFVPDYNIMVNLGSNMYKIEEALCDHIKSNARFV